MLLDFLQVFLDVQDGANTIAAATECIPSAAGEASACPASAFHAITAAFATQGYWVQADLLYLINNTGFQTWAILFYTIAAISGIISMAMGFPPKLYLWFFMGPGIFHWLVQDTVPVVGVRWNVGPSSPEDTSRQQRAQREVWKLAEVGLSNTNAFRSGNGLDTSSLISGSELGNGSFGEGFGKVRVSNLFVWYDVLVTNIVEWFIEWSGVFYLGSSDNSILAAGISALPNANMRTASAVSILGGGLGAGSDSDRGDDMHWLLSNLKWQIVMDITSAKLHNVNLRRAFIDFLASECGDAFRLGIDEAKYTAAATTRGANLPDSVFISRSLPIPFVNQNISLTPKYQVATQYLAYKSMPTHPSLRSLLTKQSAYSFSEALPYLKSNDFRKLNILETIRCDQYLYLLVQGFRWEAGHIYYQMLAGLPAGVSPATMMYTLFYGWPIHDLGMSTGNLFDNLDLLLGDFSTSSIVGVLDQYTPDGQANFMQDLILVHLFRNEMSFAPAPYYARKTGGAEAVDWTNEYQRTVGSNSKFGEVYTWALLIPYVQGILLYLLAVAYPFCCMLILVPGWHRILFTWMTFWLWVKLWDAGFAVVVVLERSIWAMIGNRSDAVNLFSRVWGMQKYGSVDIKCPDQFLVFSAQPPYGVCSPGVIPEVDVSRSIDISLGPVSVSLAGDQYLPWYNTMSILDEAMTIGAAMDLDISNSYYIYIMAALYFAVPAVTGQLVLGAKAGAASLATQAISGTAQESGRATGSAYTGSQHGRMGVMKEQARQSSNLAGQRQSGLAAQAITSGNLESLSGLQGDLSRARSQAIGQQSRVLAQNAATRTQGIGMTNSLGGYAGYTAAGMAGVVGEAGTLLSNLAGIAGGGNNQPAGSAGTGSAGTGSAGTSTGGQVQPGGLPPTGPLVRAAGATGKASGAILGQFASSAMQRGAVVGAVAGYYIDEANRGIQTVADSQQAQEAVNGWNHGADRAMYGMDASRSRAGAEYQGSESTFGMMANMASNYGGKAGAQGLSEGGGFVAQLSTGQGAAADGLLGSGARSAWNFASNGSMGNWIYGQGSRLEANYGGAATSALYSSSAGNLGSLHAGATDLTNQLLNATNFNILGDPISGGQALAGFVLGNSSMEDADSIIPPGSRNSGEASFLPPSATPPLVRMRGI